MTRIDLEHLIADVTGTSPISLERLTFGHSNKVYDVALPNKNVVLRLNAHPKMLAGTEHHLSTFAKLGFPVPRPLYADLSLTKYPVAFVILEKLPGRDLRDELAAMTRAQMTKLAKAITEFQRQAIILPRGQGFGWTHLGQSAPYKTWLDLVRRDLVEAKRALAERGYAALWTNVHARLQQHREYLENVPATCFLDDLTIKNVLVKQGELTGLIDFDWVCYGDPLYWLALTQTAIVSDIGVPGQYYLEELKRFWNVSPGQSRIVDFYAVIHALDFLRREQREISQKRLLSAVDEWLSRSSNVRNLSL